MTQRLSLDRNGDGAPLEVGAGRVPTGAHTQSFPKLGLLPPHTIAAAPVSLPQVPSLTSQFFSISFFRIDRGIVSEDFPNCSAQNNKHLVLRAGAAAAGGRGGGGAAARRPRGGRRGRAGGPR